MRVYKNSGAENVVQLRVKFDAALQAFNASPDIGTRIYQSFGRRVLQCYGKNGELL